MVQDLLHRGADLEAKDENHATPLHWACQCSGNVAVIQELVQRKVDIFVKDADNKTPFDKANALEANGAVTDFLLEQYEEKVWQREGRFSFHSILGEATYLENDQVQLSVGTLTVDELLELLVSIHSRNPDSIRSQDSNRSLPLHVACRTNAPIKVLCFFVEQDTAMLYMMNNAGSLPVHEACRGGACLEKIKLLTEKGGVDIVRSGLQCRTSAARLVPIESTGGCCQVHGAGAPEIGEGKNEHWSFAFHVGVREVGVRKCASGFADSAPRRFGLHENLLQSKSMNVK